MKKIVLLFILPLLISCGNPYDGETIINLKLKIVNSENEPLANEKSYVGASYADNGYDYSTYKKTSDSEGLIQFNMFKPTNSSSLNLEESSQYLPVTINGLNDDNFEGLNWDLGVLTLLKFDEITAFTILPNQVSANKVLYKIDLDAIKYEQQINLYTDEYLGLEPQLYHQLKKNQSFELNYQIKNTTTEEIENFSIPLTINNDELEYTLTF
jgi:hypothetical protein